MNNEKERDYMIERRVNIKQGGGYYINSLGYNNNNNVVSSCNSNNHIYRRKWIIY